METREGSVVEAPGSPGPEAPSSPMPEAIPADISSEAFRLPASELTK